MADMRNSSAVKPEGKGLLERPTLNWDYDIKLNVGRNSVLGCGPASSTTGYRPVADLSEHGNETSSFIQGGEIVG
jgi:hypothetical protein